MKITIKQAFEIFKWGIDYGQLLCEMERENEEWADAFMCHIKDHKFSMPSQPIERRRLHSENWINAKKRSYEAFLEYVAGLEQ